VALAAIHEAWFGGRNIPVPSTKSKGYTACTGKGEGQEIFYGRGGRLIQAVPVVYPVPLMQPSPSRGTAHNDINVTLMPFPRHHRDIDAVTAGRGG
jgi:hypothetical protein